MANDKKFYAFNFKRNKEIKLEVFSTPKDRDDFCKQHPISKRNKTFASPVSYEEANHMFMLN